MISEKYLDNILNRISHALDIGDDLFKEAEEEYRHLGKWINQKLEEEDIQYKVDIFLRDRWRWERWYIHYL